MTTPTKPDYFSKEFWELLQAYDKAEIEFPKLRGISFAQWALETGYGRGNESRPNSDVLPRVHKNFGGMKYREEMEPYATPVDYTDCQGKTDKYCHFEAYPNFIKAYWKRLDVVKEYRGWRNHTGSPNAFIDFVGPIWAPPKDGNTGYEAKVRSVLERLKKKGHLPGLP